MIICNRQSKTLSFMDKDFQIGESNMQSNTIKIPKNRLLQIIKEEIEKLESEINPDDLQGVSDEEEEELDEDIDILTGVPISKEQSKRNKSPQKHLDRIGLKPEPLARLANGIISEKMVINNRDELVQKCRSIGLQSFADILKSMDAMKKASDGKLGDK